MNRSPKHPTQSAEWTALERHAATMTGVHTRDLFAADPNRFSGFSARHGELLLDFSKNRVTAETMRLLAALARACEIERWRDAMASGEPVNNTEGRAAQHMALRDRSGRVWMAGGRNVTPLIATERARMDRFCDQVRSGAWRGATGKPIRTIVNIGIGGSDLGPAMVTEALAPYRHPDLAVHFVANVDGSAIGDTLALCDPESTLFLVATKTFTTIETMTNAATARGWLAERLGQPAIGRHFVGLTANAAEAQRFGVDPELIFQFWDWVGGRFSLWSSVGLSIALSIGPERYAELQDGARSMDEHFLTSPIETNLPVLLALIGIWNIDFLGARTLAILPYDHRLRHLPAHLQQLDMESNGKRVDRDGLPVSCVTAPIVFGDAGTNGQHAFYQLIHQGEHRLAGDFLLAANGPKDLDRHHRILLANALAQSEAMMRGMTEAEVRQQMSRAGASAEQIELLAPHRTFPGNIPSNTLVYPRLDPGTLGMLIALYEHKIVVQGFVWGINSFDQWGVELGKTLAETILPELTSAGEVRTHDSSTNGLIAAIKAMRSTN